MKLEDFRTSLLHQQDAEQRVHPFGTNRTRWVEALSSCQSCASGPALPHLTKCILGCPFCLFFPLKVQHQCSLFKWRWYLQQAAPWVFPLQSLVLNKTLLSKNRNECTVPAAVPEAKVLTTGGQLWPLSPTCIYQHSKLLSKEPYIGTIKASTSLQISHHMFLNSKNLERTNKINFPWPNSSLRVCMKVFSRLLCAISVLLDTVLQCYMPQMAAYPKSVIRAPGTIKSKNLM